MVKKVIVKVSKKQRVGNLATFLRHRLEEERADAEHMAKDEWPKSIHVVPKAGNHKAFIAVQPMDLHGDKKYQKFTAETELNRIGQVTKAGIAVWNRGKADDIVARCDAIERIIRRAETVVAHTPRESAVDAFIFVLINLVQEYKEYPGFDKAWRV